MQSEKNPGQKRNIGPAMQWAKRRNASGATSEQPTSKAKIQLDFNTDEDRGSAPTAPRQTLPDKSSATPSSREDRNHEKSAYKGGSSSPYNADQPDIYSSDKSGHGAENQQSAWEYYAHTPNREPIQRSQHNRPEMGAAQPPGPARNANYNGESYLQDTHAGNSTLPNASSGDLQYPSHSGTRANTNRTTKNVSVTQYLLPLLVIVVIVVVGILASLG